MSTHPHPHPHPHPRRAPCSFRSHPRRLLARPPPKRHFLTPPQPRPPRRAPRALPSSTRRCAARASPRHIEAVIKRRVAAVLGNNFHLPLFFRHESQRNDRIRRE